MNRMTVTSGKKASATLMWIRFAEADYVAARLLLLVGFLVQGIALANTALEKYIKGICSHMDVKWPKREHSVAILFDILKTGSPDEQLNLNLDFLKLTAFAYRLRYPDMLPEGFTLALSQAMVLAQLDRSVLAINQCFKLEWQGAPLPLAVEEAIQKADPRYLEHNIAIAPSDTKEFFASVTKCYDIRKYRGIVAELHYEGLNIADDLKFDREGLVPDPNDPTKCTPAFSPIDPQYAKINTGVVEK
jgi:HEPN domain-containing protein